MHNRFRTSPSAPGLLLSLLATMSVAACADDDSPNASRSADLSSAACASSGLVAPVLTPLTGKLWPPNHKFHDVSVSDCVAINETCDPGLRAQFIWASSDEPEDSIGDGHFAPDILLDDDCQVVSLRAERQGPKDGRVYRLGVRVFDGAGNAYESECAFIVDHDQRGIDGADSGQAYRLTFDGTNGAQMCGGPTTEPPVTEPPVAQPPATEPPAPPAGSEIIP